MSLLQFRRNQSNVVSDTQDQDAGLEPVPEEAIKDVQDVQSNLMQDIRWKYKEVNCVDK